MTNLRSIKQHQENSESLRTVGEVLSFLLEKKGLSESELSRQTGVTQQTISSITRGQTGNPRVETVATLAKFFDISVEQLIGMKPLISTPTNAQKGSSAHQKYKLIPILDWDRVNSFLEGDSFVQGRSNVPWIKYYDDADRCFAIRSSSSLEPLIRRDAILILSPRVKPSNNDFVLVCFGKNSYAVRMFIQEGGTSYLKPIDISLPSTPLVPEHNILGTVVSMQFNLNV